MRRLDHSALDGRLLIRFLASDKMCVISVSFPFSPLLLLSFLFFFFNDTATTEIYTLSLHDALPISEIHCNEKDRLGLRPSRLTNRHGAAAAQSRSRSTSAIVPKIWSIWLFSTISGGDRKSTRLNFSHTVISYAVFCLKKKKKTILQLAALSNEMTVRTILFDEIFRRDTHKNNTVISLLAKIIFTGLVGRRRFCVRETT